MAGHSIDLTIITVTWNSKELIGKQINSVKEGASRYNIEHIIVDNASTDGTPEFIKKNFPEIIFIENKEGKGFGKANNQAVKMAKGHFLLFLNPDMRVEKGSLDIVLDWMKANPTVGIMSPKLIDEHENINFEAMPRRFPKVWEQVALILKLPHIFPSLFNKYLMKDMDLNKEQEVDSVRGSFMLMRKEIADKLGWAFDPRYYIWFEDVDTCREVKQLGYKIIYSPIISAVDYVGQSFKKRDSLWKQKQFTKSMLQYFQKWEPMHKWIWIWLARPIGITMVWIREKFSK